MNIYELAHELNTTTSRVLTQANQLNCRRYGAASRIEEPLADQIRAAFYERERPRPTIWLLLLKTRSYQLRRTSEGVL